MKRNKVPFISKEVEVDISCKICHQNFLSRFTTTVHTPGLGLALKLVYLNYTCVLKKVQKQHPTDDGNKVKFSDI